MRLSLSVVLCCLGLSAAQNTLLQASAPGDDCCTKLASIGFTSNIPVVILYTNGAEIPHKVDTPITLCTCNNGAAFEDYNGPAIAAGRGSSSANFTKKSYKIELQEIDGPKYPFPFLGMPGNTDWILYGPELDKTVGMRNYLTYYLAQASGRYASRRVYCEVLVVDNGQPLGPEHYNGVYIALEKVERGNDRVDISKLDPPNLSGGYVFLYDNDNHAEGDVTFGPANGWTYPFQMKDPKDAPPEALAWLLNYINDFQSALAAPDWLQQYPAFIDTPAFIDYFLLVELTKNPDGYRGSTYMHKDRDAPMAMGPAWDYNEAYGTCCGYPIDGWQDGGESGPGVSGGSAISPNGWRFNICDDPGRCLVQPGDGTSRWYRKIWQDPQYRSGANVRWSELRAVPWCDGELTRVVNGLVASLRPAVLRNYERFSTVLLDPRYSNGEEMWDAEVSAFLNWTLERVAWLDGAMSTAASGAVSGPGPQNQTGVAG